jgi:hypothetical protein
MLSQDPVRTLGKRPDRTSTQHLGQAGKSASDRILTQQAGKPAGDRMLSQDPGSGRFAQGPDRM